MLNTFSCEITHLDACIWISGPASKHWILIFSIFFPNLLGIISLQCWFPPFGPLGVQVASEVVMTHSTDQQLFIPLDYRLSIFMHLGAGFSLECQLFCRLIKAIYCTGHFHEQQSRGFLFGYPCQGTAGEGCKDSNTEAESADMGGRQTQNRKNLLGFAQTPVAPPAGTN